MLDKLKSRTLPNVTVLAPRLTSTPFNADRGLDCQRRPDLTELCLEPLPLSFPANYSGARSWLAVSSARAGILSEPAPDYCLHLASCSEHYGPDCRGCRYEERIELLARVAVGIGPAGLAGVEALAVPRERIGFPGPAVRVVRNELQAPASSGARVGLMAHYSVESAGRYPVYVMDWRLCGRRDLRAVAAVSFFAESPQWVRQIEVSASCCRRPRCADRLLVRAVWQEPAVSPQSHSL